MPTMGIETTRSSARRSVMSWHITSGGSTIGTFGTCATRLKRRSTRTIGGGEDFYNPNDEGVDDDDADEGGWSGGEYVLGVAKEGAVDAPTSTPSQPLSRRELMAKAAEER